MYVSTNFKIYGAIPFKWKSYVNKGSSFGALLTDLSKAFECLLHKLSIAKLHAYGFSLIALRLVCSYLTNREPKLILNIILGKRYCSEHLASILGPLLFNIFLCDLFFAKKKTEFAIYADDNATYTSG